MITGLVVSFLCWAKPIMAHMAAENRLPKSTGRAEVTVLPVDFSARCACRFFDGSMAQS
jgi:hypothetical protein